MNVLLSAYACSPLAGSEPGFGWNWAVSLADRGIHVTVLTRGEGRERIEAYLAAQPHKFLRFEYFNLPTKLVQSGRGFHYILWQWLAVRVARRLHRERHFDVIHHVTFGSIHVPTQLWRLGVPTVFGPVGGGQIAPTSLLKYFGEEERHERFRTFITKALRYSPFHRSWFSHMRAVFAANADTLKLLHDLGKTDAKLEFDVGIPSDYLAEQPKQYPFEDRPLRILWVARMMPRKALPLAFDALMQVKQPWTLTIVGSGLPEEVVHGMISERELDGRVFWAGRRLTMDEVRSEYLQHDVLLFTSVRETCGVQLLEAMAVGLPIITLDLHGAKSLIPDDGGYKVPVVDANEVVSGLAAAIDQFSSLAPHSKAAMSRKSWEFARTCTWTSRAEKAETIYKELIGTA